MSPQDKPRDGWPPRAYGDSTRAISREGGNDEDWFPAIGVVLCDWNHWNNRSRACELRVRHRKCNNNANRHCPVWRLLRAGALAVDKTHSFGGLSGYPAATDL